MEFLVNDWPSPFAKDKGYVLNITPKSARTHVWVMPDVRPIWRPLPLTTAEIRVDIVINNCEEPKQARRDPTEPCTLDSNRQRAELRGGFAF